MNKTQPRQCNHRGRIHLDGTCPKCKKQVARWIEVKDQDTGDEIRFMTAKNLREIQDEVGLKVSFS